jgi:orotate phosphoribosyltransferase
LVEDLISSGKSSLDAASVLKETGIQVKGIVSIFTYGFDAATENFKTADCEYVSLSDYNTLLPQAIESQYIEESDLAILKQWRENPSIWKK